MNISIAIADINRNYLERLVEVLQEYEDLSVSIFTNAERLEEALQAKHYDIVLFDPDICDKKMSFYNTKMSVCLYSDEARNAQLYPECNKVLKYQRISRIYKDIVKAYADKVGNWADFDKSQNTRLVAVYSPIGGSGKTTIALAIASKLTALGKTVLFLSMEQLDSTACVNAHTEEEDGITMLLQAVVENSNFELKLKGSTKKGFNGIYYVEGFERIVDYNTVDKEEMYSVVDKIRKSGSYDVVIVDMGSCYDAMCQAVFEQADNILIVERAGELPARKMEMFAQQAMVREHAGKMCKVSNFMDSNSKVSNALNVENIGSIRNYGTQALREVVQAMMTKESLNVNTFVK
ncbi:MAG: AAA family ATPase [Lachnospiraceae bacterium]|nr:AAA family ATPase [Lachnospiraceae bacterium]